mmetsp:Transcript_12493/g.30316  ORF Transcript_12493/g.30316 Transcript_12493/m.30316 type:complete len:99 (-) Transcript_12493:246-542(-)
MTKLFFTNTTPKSIIAFTLAAPADGLDPFSRPLPHLFLLPLLPRSVSNAQRGEGERTCDSVSNRPDTQGVQGTPVKHVDATCEGRRAHELAEALSQLQ